MLPDVSRGVWGRVRGQDDVRYVLVYSDAALPNPDGHGRCAKVRGTHGGRHLQRFVLGSVLISGYRSRSGKGVP